MKARLPPILFLLVLTTALAACGGGSADTAPSGQGASAAVEIAEFAYSPDPAEVEVGDTVTWTNRDSAPHTATADDGSFDTGTLDQGQPGSVTFAEAGSFAYFCEIHPTMRGIVEVAE